MYLPAERRFIMVNKITIILLYVVILAGGVVRSTGSGMGCPDWPKCFNRIIPPTHASQLPADYEQHYIDGRAEKNERFAGMLEKLGFQELAHQLRNDDSILEHEEFNATKTWTEYINRLAGATLGIFIILCVVFAPAFWRFRKRIFFLSLLNLFVVGFQGWLGSIVVSTNLTPWVITVHMLLALVILAISIYTYYQARVARDRSILLNQSSFLPKALAILALVLTLVQVVIGTDIREAIDEISKQFNGQQRELWVGELGDSFLWHRELALAAFVLNLVLFFIVRARYPKNGEQSRMVNWMMLLMVLQIVSGLVLAYFAMPAYMQTVHLLLATFAFGVQYYLLLLLSKTSHYIGL
jgi:cytochrome c oxidase assembly protein subunit 15